MARPSGRNGNAKPDLGVVVSKDAINAIEKKPHAMYIKYLLSKRCGPSFIISELHKLGLSAPSNDFLVDYFNLQVDPLIRKNKITKLYADYKAKINGRKRGVQEYASRIINFKTEIGDADAVTQANFCKFIKELGVEEAWMWEITRCYKVVENFPKDENGIRILSSNLGKTQLNKVASSKNRYIIEKLLLENISIQGISRYTKETLKDPMTSLDISMFKEVFFNTKLNTIEQNIEIVENELKSQMEVLRDIKAGAKQFATLPPGDKAIMERQVSQRINELDDNLRNLKASHSDLSYNTKAVNTGNYRAMFEDVMIRGYKKFCSYDQSNDRDIASSMAKVAKIMSEAHDKIDKIDHETNRAEGLDDLGVRENLASLQQERLDEIEREEKERANAALAEAGMPALDDNLDLNDIGGVEELGLDFVEDEKDKRNEKGSE